MLLFFVVVFNDIYSCFSEDGAMVTIDVGLAYRDDTVSEWTAMAHSFEQRKLNCNFTAMKARTEHFLWFTMTCKVKMIMLSSFACK